MSTFTLQPPPQPPLRILLLDDDESILRMQRIFLRQQGFKVSTAQNGREGLLRLAKEPFDLVIVDVNMPQVDGLRFSQEALCCWPWIKLIICTGYYSLSIKDKAEELGISDILQKPLSSQTLNESIHSLFPGLERSADFLERENPACLQQNLSILSTLHQTVLSDLHSQPALAACAETLKQQTESELAAVYAKTQNFSLLVISSRNPLDQDTRSQLLEQMQQHVAVFDPGMSLPQAARHEQNDHPDNPPTPLPDSHLFPIPLWAGDHFAGMLFTLPTEDHTPPEASTVLLMKHTCESILCTLDHLGSLPGNDPLTGLPNRCWMEERAEWLWQQQQHHTLTPGALVIDINDLKELNDQHGASAGDNLLKETARLLRSHHHIQTDIARMGDDEFMILYHNCTHETLQQEVEKLRGELTKLPSPIEGDAPLCVQVKFGTYLQNEKTNTLSGSEFIECAEHALTTAQRGNHTQALSWSDVCESDALSYDHKRILVVDDDRQVLHLVRRMLNHSIYDVQGAGSVAEATTLLEEGNAFDVLLTDLSLPHQDGSDMLRLAAKIDPELVVIVVSGNISSESEELLRQQGAFAIIKKPFDLKSVRSVVAKAIKARQASCPINDPILPPGAPEPA